jgi:Uma2 family endonuclease
MTTDEHQPVPDYLLDTYNMLRCAYPGSVPDEDYIALLAVLHEEMSFRTEADVLSALTGKDWGRVYNDISSYAAIDTINTPTHEDLERVKAKLAPCGFAEWVANDEIPAKIKAGSSGRNYIAAENVTYEDYLTERYGRHVEWVNGTVMMMPQPNLSELELRWFLRTLFEAYLEAAGGGRASGDPFTMKTGTDLPARQPDVFVVLPERLPLLRERELAGAANLVVEITSAETFDLDRGTKFREYEQGGVQEYWILDPKRKEALFYVRGEDELFHSRLPVEGVYTSAVLPRLKFPVSLFWQDKLPGIEETIRMVNTLFGENS